MPTKKETTIAPERLALYDKLVAAVPGVERKGATIPYTAHNGHMFSQFNTDGSFLLKLPAEMMPTFLKKYKTECAVSYGVVRKDYAVVPESLFKKTPELASYFVKSYEYVASLKPKATKKAKK